MIHRKRITLVRAGVEIGAILFLFYANLLMGEFTRHAPPARTLLEGLADIFTLKVFGIGLVTGILGFVSFEFLREHL